MSTPGWPVVLLAVVVLFPISEVALAFVKRSRGDSARSEDRGSMRVLWLSILLGMALAIAAQWIPGTRLPIPASVARLAAGVLHRVAREERALLDSLGPAYADYCARTKRFVPGLF